MATGHGAPTLTLVAADDLSSHQYKFVALGTSTKTGQAVLAATAGMVTLGVLLNKPKAGEEALIQYAGVAKVKVGGTQSAAGALLTNGATDDAGCAITATVGGVNSTDVTGSNIIGQYLGAAAGAAGAIVEVLLSGRIGVAP